MFTSNPPGSLRPKRSKKPVASAGDLLRVDDPPNPAIPSSTPDLSASPTAAPVTSPEADPGFEATSILPTNVDVTGAELDDVVPTLTSECSNRGNGTKGGSATLDVPKLLSVADKSTPGGSSASSGLLPPSELTTGITTSTGDTSPPPTSTTDLLDGGTVTAEVPSSGTNRPEGERRYQFPGRELYLRFVQGASRISSIIARDIVSLCGLRKNNWSQVNDVESVATGQNRTETPVVVDSSQAALDAETDTRQPLDEGQTGEREDRKGKGARVEERSRPPATTSDAALLEGWADPQAGKTFRRATLPASSHSRRRGTYPEPHKRQLYHAAGRKEQGRGRRGTVSSDAQRVDAILAWSKAVQNEQFYGTFPKAGETQQEVAQGSVAPSTGERSRSVRGAKEVVEAGTHTRGRTTSVNLRPPPRFFIPGNSSNSSGSSILYRYVASGSYSASEIPVRNDQTHYGFLVPHPISLVHITRGLKRVHELRSRSRRSRETLNRVGPVVLEARRKVVVKRYPSNTAPDVTRDLHKSDFSGG